MYSTAKAVIAGGMIILLIIAFWMKASDISEIHGFVRGGGRHIGTSPISAGGVFFFAMLFAAGLIAILIRERKDKEAWDREDRKSTDYPEY